MRIVVTGGSSFVGAHFCRLAARSHPVLAIYNATPLRLNGVTAVRLDLGHDRGRLAALQPDVVVHLAYRVMGEVGSLNDAMMDAVLAAGAPVVYGSSTCAHWSQDSAYAEGRRRDEARLASSGLPFSVVRPCAPYGPHLVSHRPSHRESFHTLADLVRALPVVPVLGDGRYRRQPVHVEDLSLAVLRLCEQGPDGGSYDAGGPEPLTMDEVVDGIAAAMGRKVGKLHLPKAFFSAAARFTPDLDAQLLATANCDDVVDPRPLAEATGVRPRPFERGVRDLV